MAVLAQDAEVKVSIDEFGFIEIRNNRSGLLFKITVAGNSFVGESENGQMLFTPSGVFVVDPKE